MIVFWCKPDIPVTAECDRADIGAVRQVVFEHDIPTCLIDFGRGEGHLDPVNLGRLKQSARVGLQAKYL